MSEYGNRYSDSGPAVAYTGNTDASDGVSPPSYALHDDHPANIYPTYHSTRIYVSRSRSRSREEETRPLLPSRAPRPAVIGVGSNNFSVVSVVSVRHLATFLKVVLAWAVVYALYSYIAVPAQVGHYKALYDVARVENVHLTKTKLALQGEVSDLQGRLADAKVDAFWEMARVADTNMDVWVGADDTGTGSKFWSYGITSGRYNANHPPVTLTKLRFTADQAAIVDSTERHRIVGYRVESNRRNNGWWIASGLIEFGEAGSHQLRFSARQGPPHNGAEYDVVVFYATWHQ